ISKTCIITSDVPDLDGVPPSTAVTVRFITGCFSLSSVFCKTNLSVNNGSLSLTSRIFISTR
uniref:Uncharacterized protein n=1 Tax=Oreochromis niloticus TaxID=8128 RepID=A0A669EQS6_ORENI